ncbi:MAG: ribosome maturation factor RimP [Elusimicrobia bacterium]|nr:ribosome maturation factor RimP [Elusimicrobiota bacterium]
MDLDKEKLEKEVEPILAGDGFELVDLKIGRHKNKVFIQFFIDRPDGGISLDDCEKMSETIGAFLDMSEVSDSFILEVSSPGIDRILRKESDFERFKGSKVKVRLKKPVEGARVYYAELGGCENGNILLSDGANKLNFRLEEIEEIRLNPSHEDLFKPR